LITVFTGLFDFFLVIAFALVAVLLKTIDGRGFLASVLVGIAIIYGGGLMWFVIVAVFFVLGVIFTLYKYGYKKRIGGAQEKGGARNWPNILANGGVASAIALVNFYSPSATLAATFLGAVSASAADTAATELGLLSPGKPRLITNPSKFVSPGTSGGVSWFGFAGAFFASLVIGVIAFALGILQGIVTLVVLCAAGGVAGAVMDSLLGALVQRRGYCSVCLKPTEALSHCGEHTRSTGGVSFIENNVVNVLATVTGAAVSLGLYLAIIR
jgi:uncharacterized protein (TIGR00297 family)